MNANVHRHFQYEPISAIASMFGDGRCHGKRSKWNEMPDLEKSQAEAEGAKLMRQQQEGIDQERRDRQNEASGPTKR